MIDVLNKHFQNSLHVSKAQSACVQGAWYSAYFLLALPSGWVARRFGYRRAILLGLFLVVAGSLLFVPVAGFSGTQVHVFEAFLGALFVVGAGLTFVETIANPYATVLGPAESAVARINLGQSCNAVGWILGPLIGGSFVLSRTGVANTSNAALYMPYLIVAGIVVVLLVAFSIGPVPDVPAALEEEDRGIRSSEPGPLLKESHFVLAIVSQFLYCAGQIGIFSFFINYVKDGHTMPPLPGWFAQLLPEAMKFSQNGLWHMTEYGAGILLSVAFVFFTIGRFSGSVILRFCRPHITLGVYAVTNVALMAAVIAQCGWVSVFALILSFFFMSIMYPTHFALGIHGLGSKTKIAASWMVTAVVGGAIMPIFMGWIADRYSMRLGFIMPLACFVFIACYGFSWRRLYAREATPASSGA
jgi:FHS family L-fucose permease-like MFS transporter